MPVAVAHLRRWFAAAAIAAVLVVAGAYFYERHRVQNALTQVPEKIGLEIKQTATGFTVSKSEQGRTLFRIQASKAVQFRQGGKANLHNVEITLYGRDSSRFDRIYGAEFQYDPDSGDVVAQGAVQIDLQSNPGGLTSADQAPPQELKNPIHLKTTGLVFNQKTGDAYTREKVEFRVPQGQGSAMGMTYVAKTNVLTMESQVRMTFESPAATVTAARATITKDPHLVVLQHPHVDSGGRQGEADEATLFLRNDNTLDSAKARGNVRVWVTEPTQAEATSEQLDLNMTERGGALQSAIFSGNVRAQASGAQPLNARAGRVTLDFAGKNLVAKVVAEENVRIEQHANPAVASSRTQNLELDADKVDFLVADGRRLKNSETYGSAQIIIRPGTVGTGQQTVVAAGKFEGHFDVLGQLTTVHGAPNARIVSRNPGQPDRTSTSHTVDADFRPGSGIESLLQQGSVAYVDGERKAWGDLARYTPADQHLLLTGTPRVVDGSMTTTAHIMRLNRATGDAFAEGDVKTTYSDLTPQPQGALLSSSSPIHVTAHSMMSHGASATALYSGDARLWQDANIVEAPAIDFDRDHRSVIAHGTDTHGAKAQTVSTVLIQTDNTGKSTPIFITSQRLTYTDNQREAHFEGGVEAKGSDLTITSNQMTAFLEARGQSSAKQPVSAGKLEKIVATDKVAITQPGRHGDGEQLVYTAADDKFVLSGGSPSIFDAEHGKITGVSLTFFRRDDRVLVEGNEASPALTQTRVAR
jgi:lipopolysaccharide export system protein LptA